jgi:hypothetical protein
MSDMEGCEFFTLQRIFGGKKPNWEPKDWEPLIVDRDGQKLLVVFTSYELAEQHCQARTGERWEIAGCARKDFASFIASEIGLKKCHGLLVNPDLTMKGKIIPGFSALMEFGDLES